MLQNVDPARLKVSALTHQERECLRLVAEQRSSKEIARELGISKASVDTYCNRARAKLGVSSRRAAARLVIGAERDSPPAAPETALAPSPSPPPVVKVSMLPPLARLGFVERLVVIVAGAAVLAVAFGMLLSGMQTLNAVVDAARHSAGARAG